MSWVVQTFGYSLLAVLFAAVVARIALPGTPGWARFLSHPALRAMGKYSYATYVIHVPLKVVAMHYFGSAIAASAATRPLVTDLAFVGTISLSSVALAVVSYVVIEKPALALKDRWAPRAG